MEVTRLRFFCEQCKKRNECNDIHIEINNAEEINNILNLNHIIHLDVCPANECLQVPNNSQKIEISCSTLNVTCSGKDPILLFRSFVIVDNVFLQYHNIYTLNEKDSMNYNYTGDKIILIDMLYKYKQVQFVKNIMSLVGYELTPFYDTIFQLDKQNQTRLPIK